MIRNENGRPTEAGTPDAATERVSAPPTAYPQSNWHALPRGATPFAEVTYIDARDWMTEPQDMGDALALDRMDDTLQAAQDDARWGVSFFVHYCGGGDRRGAA